MLPCLIGSFFPAITLWGWGVCVQRYIPRNVLIDLEPRVIGKIKESNLKHLFNPENFFLPKDGDGGGAGNNWASGYSQGIAMEEDLFHVINREIEGCDSMEVCLWFFSPVVLHRLCE